MFKKRALAVVCLLALMFQTVSFVSYAAEDDQNNDELALETPFVPTYKSGSYGEFLQNNARTLDDVEDGKRFYADVANPKSASDNVTKETITSDDNITVDNVIVTQETGYVEFNLTVPSTGIYVLGIDYLTYGGKGGNIERKITVNGQLQYAEAATALLDRYFVDENALEHDFDPAYYFTEDSAGNQSRGAQVERKVWLNDSYFLDSTRSYSEPLKFVLNAGTNVIRLDSVRESVAIKSLYAYTVPLDRSYSDFLYEYGDQVVTTEQVKDHEGWEDGSVRIQAEYPTGKNQAMLYASFDRASAATEPPSSSSLKLNIMGGDRWKTIGQWVEYKVTVPKSGLYKISMRYRQNLASGIFSSREITVNGELAYDENIVAFPYGGNWGVTTPTDSLGDPVLYYFHEGENTIRVKAVSGQLSDLLNTMSNVTNDLQNDYIKITAITGPDPDEFQDYNFNELIPEVILDLKAQGDLLSQIYDRLYSILGEEGEITAQLKEIITNLYKLYENPDLIAEDLRNIENAISSIGDFVYNSSEQPVEIDWIDVSTAETPLAEAEKGMLDSLAHQVIMFFASFTTEMSTISGEPHPEYEEEVRVWVVTSRDYAILTRQIIDRGFVHEYGVNTEFELYPGILSNSIMAGDVCDVMMNGGQGSIQDYAARNCLYPMNFFYDRSYEIIKNGEATGKTANVEGYKTIKSRFPSATFGAVTIERKKYPNEEDNNESVFLVYGIPQDLNISLLFYRSDVIDAYNIAVPKAWDEYYDLIPLLRKYGMEVEVPQIDQAIYQRGSTKYLNYGREVNFGSDEYLDTFDWVNDFYTQYKCPVSYDANNRFKTGEMPILQGALGTWVTLYVFVPEIQGLWEFDVYPGVLQEDGTVNNVVVPTVNSYLFMLADGQNHENGWSFIQWWTSTDAQVEYAREAEALVGTTARYSSANIEAFKSSPWKASELDVLLEQIESLRPAEVAIGDFMSARYLDFAKTEAVIDGTSDGHETILSHIKEMNQTIANKREELNMPK